MQRFNQINSSLLAYLSSFLLLEGIFLATMGSHYRVVDFHYLGWATAWIALLSILPATLAYLLSVKRWHVAAALGGLVGLVLAIVFVAAQM